MPRSRANLRVIESAVAPARRGNTAEPGNATDRIVASITNAIVERRLMPGTRLAEQKIADIFKVSRRRKKGVRPAGDLLKENRKAIVDKVAYWTGVPRPVVKKLIESIASRVEEMGLRADVRLEKEHLTEAAGSPGNDRDSIVQVTHDLFRNLRADRRAR